MRKLASIFDLILVVALVWCLGACSLINKDGAGEAEERPDEPAMGMRADPLELSRDRQAVPIVHPGSGNIYGRPDSSEFKTGSAASPSSEADVPGDEIDTVTNQAYRVQIFTSKLSGEAKKARTIAREIFDRAVYMDYEVPYYKVRVGSFANRYDAEDYQMRAKAAGYDNAWVVLVNVALQELPPIYDEVPPDSAGSPHDLYGPGFNEYE